MLVHVVLVPGARVRTASGATARGSADLTEEGGGNRRREGTTVSCEGDRSHVRRGAEDAPRGLRTIVSRRGELVRVEPLQGR